MVFIGRYLCWCLISSPTPAVAAYCSNRRRLRLPPIPAVPPNAGFRMQERDGTSDRLEISSQ